MQDFLSRISHFSPKRLALLADGLQRRVESLEQEQRAPIAIIGIGCRFPGGADTPERYWDLLTRGVDAISEVPPSRWDIDAYYDANPDAPGKMSTRYGGFLADVDLFDPYFFGISPREAQRMDPQQRLLLEVTWEALEHAGINADRLSETKASVFLGLSASDYFQVMHDAGLESFDAYTASGTAHSIASGRLSYLLGIRGPSLSIDTACSSSLVAIHQAMQSLRRGESEIALAGGVNLILRPEITVALTKSHMMAPDGRCKAFDARADGFVRGEGCGMLVLKRLADAQASGDNIIAVIRGSAANQDGRSNGLTAPNGPSQEAVLRDALTDAQLEGRAVGVVEAHGTGTSLGDPIEVRALAKVFGAEREPDQPILVASVKANIGHLEACAGVAGVIKMALSLHHGLVPPQQHFLQPNPFIPWDELPVRVPTALEPWPGAHDSARVGGVSSFGFSGTNVHMLLEAPPAPVRRDSPIERPRHLITISAKTDRARAALAAQYRTVLASGRMSLADIAHTANVGRAAMPQRMAVVATTAEQAIALLDGLGADNQSPSALSGTAAVRVPRVAFLFTGQGSQYPGMTRSLYDTQPTFRDALDACAGLLAPLLPVPLLSLLFPEDGAASLLDDTAYTQPAIFAVEYALAAMWQSWGVQPTAVFGHSIGEFVAACVAGIIALPDALRLVTERGRLMGALPRDGAMVAVLTDEARAQSLIAAYAGAVSIAAVNGPQNVVISGRAAAVDAIIAAATAAGISTTRLQVSHAFHSPLMEPMIAAFREVAESITYRAPAIDVISNVTGEPFGSTTASADYWCRHVRAPVLFAQGVQTLAAMECSAFIEVGPHPTLLSLARQTLSDDGRLWLPTVRRTGDDWSQVLESLAALYVHGAEIDWAGFDAGYARVRQVLPGYPFQRDRYWVEVGPRVLAALPASERLHPVIEREVLHAVSTDRVFESHISTARFDYLEDHRIFGRLLLPSPMLMEMAHAAGGEVFRSHAIVISDFSMRNPIPVSRESTVTTQLVLGDSDDGVMPFRIAVLVPGSERWTTCAAGTVGRAGPAPSRLDLAGLQQANPDPISVPDYYDWLASLDLEFGPRFRGILTLTHGRDSALARMALPEGLDANGYAMHPAVLDACFHVVGAALRTSERAITKPYLLSHAERLTIYRPLPASFWAHVELDGDAAKTMSVGLARATVTLLDDAGAVLVRVEGLQLQEILVRPQFETALAPAVQQMLHEVSWIEGPPADLTLPTPVALAAAVAPRISVIAGENGLAEYADFSRALDRLCTSYILEAFTTLGADWQVGSRFAAQELQSRLGVLSRHERLFSRLLNILAEDGCLRRDGDHWQVIELPAFNDAELAYATVSEAHPSGETALVLTRRCARELAPVLRGQTDPIPLLFPGGSLTEMERLYQSSPPARTYNQLLAEALRPVRDAHAGHRPLRILEVGAGTGSTSAYVLPMFAGREIEYTFTDVSTLFLNRAREKFAEVHGMRYATLDIGGNLTEQGFALAHYDVVIGANVMHATPDLQQTMRNVCALLVPGGLAVLLEGTSPQRFGDLTVGLLDGWWAFTDTDRRQYALMPRQAWLSLLRDSGFVSSAVIVDSDAGPVLEEQAIFVAQAPAETALPTKQRWLILPDSSGFAADLAQRLQLAGDDAAIIAGDDATQIGTVLAASGRKGSTMTGVIYLRALDNQLTDETSADTLWYGQQRLLSHALQAVQTLAASPTPVPLWFVTRGAQSTAVGESANPAQATLWGLSHVVAIEHPELSCRRIDLDAAVSTEAMTAGIIRELHTVSSEDQVALRGERRLLRRLKGFVPANVARVSIAEDCTYLITGGLRGLGLRMAEWAVDQGARSLALVGRQDPDTSAELVLARLRARGATVAAMRADVSHEGDVLNVLHRIRDTMPRLAGVIHSAGALDDGVIASQSWPRFENVMAAKVLGSWHLHRLAGPLDFLVLFSSGASVAGSAGQSNHASANAFEDALAWYRQAQGQPTVSINWGPWADIGAAAERRVTGGSFLRQIQPKDGLQALDAALRPSSDGRTFARAQIAVLAADWSQIGRDDTPLLQAPLFRLLATGRVDAKRVSHTASPSTATVTLRERLQATVANRRRAALVDEVRQLTVRVLGIQQTGLLDVNEPLRQLGLDSLMAVELRNLLGKAVGTTLPATITFDHPTVHALVEYLGAQVFAEELSMQSAPSVLMEVPLARAPVQAAANLDEMTDDELAARLAQRLDGLRTEDVR